MVEGVGGFVAVGSGNFWDSDGFRSATSRAKIWQSADGVTWQRIALPADLDNRASRLTSVVATDLGFVAVGEATADGDVYSGPSQGFVLTSPDGVTWTLAAQLHNQWSIAMESVRANGSTLLATGVVYVCETTASALITGGALFSSNVVCPDGAPANLDLSDRAACRL